MKGSGGREQTVADRVRSGYLPVVLLAVLVCVVGVVAPAWASGDEHGDTAELRHVVDLEGKTGFNLFMARIYNDNRLLYALVVTGIMAAMGIIVAKVTGLVLRLIGVG